MSVLYSTLLYPTLFNLNKRGKGGGFIKATLKNFVTGNSYEKPFTSDEMVEHADLERKPVSYSWADELNYIFMDLETFEEVILPQTEVELGHFLVAGQEVCRIHHRNICTTFISLYVHFVCRQSLRFGKGSGIAQFASDIVFPPTISSEKFSTFAKK
jgi:translation elongation factor P/translation initiation factor 5A